MKKAFLYLWGKLLFLTRKIDYRIIQTSTFPPASQVLGNRIYIVGQQGFPKWAIMRCPCGCKEQLTLSLMKQKKPNWEISIQNQKISLSPSVWKNEGCRSHFFLKKGKVIWTSD